MDKKFQNNITSRSSGQPPSLQHVPGAEFQIHLAGLTCMSVLKVPFPVPPGSQRGQEEVDPHDPAAWVSVSSEARSSLGCVGILTVDRFVSQRREKGGLLGLGMAYESSRLVSALPQLGWWSWQEGLGLD